VAGGGIAILGARGVEVAEGILESVCRKLHAPYFKSMGAGLPWVELKLALGSDGGIGPLDQRTNITSPEAQSLAHSLRRASDGIIVGRNTIAVDDPQLTDRWPEPSGQHRIFHRIVLDSHGSLNPTCRVWQKAAGHSSIRALTDEAKPIEGVKDLRLPPSFGGCSLRHLLQELKHLGICRLLVEGGATLARQMLQDGLVDVLHIFRSNMPAGGTVVALEGCRLDPPTKFLRFDGGIWEIWERQICHNA
jgi:diaminohydroxyphosphoribosylaminopyrimidine deaminase/5-amino-6-(5-phosphoribosylamino)uracil reductase